MFQLTVKAGQLDRLRRLNEQYEPVMAKAAASIEGLNGIEKWLLGNTYVERIDFDGDFTDFAAQFGSDKEIRQFLRSVNECFVQSLGDMPDRQMSCLQALPS
jgi:hypothetical protein